MANELLELLTWEGLWLLLGAFLIGAEKAGIKGLSMLSVSIYAIILGGKASAGLILLLFMMADLFAVYHYYRWAKFSTIFRMLIPAIVGVVLGALLGQQLDDELFKDIIGWIIMVSLGLMLWPQLNERAQQVGDKIWWAMLIGFITGFSTMIANVSSPILILYLLALQLPKQPFIATIVWFFFIINIIKLPFHIWSWHTIQWTTLKMALLTIPVIALGFLIGLSIIKKLNEKRFRYLIISVTIIAAVRLLWS